jgi:diguanylate cyclase (GGDEF)-like protein
MLHMLELLDVRTLFFAGALVAGVFGPVMFEIMRTRKTYPGYGKWAAAEISFAALFLLQAVRGLVSESVPVVLGNGTACCAMILLVQGTSEFCGQHKRYTWIYVVSAIYLCAILYFFYVTADLRIRTLLAGSYLASMTVYAAFPLLRRAPEGRQFGYSFAAAVLLFGALIGISRVYAVAKMARLTTIFTRAPVNTAFFLTDLMFIVGITFSFFVLTNERSVADLRDSNIALAHEVGERQQAENALRSEMAQRKALETQLKELVITDALTGVLNRRGLIEALKVEIQRADRLKNPLVVLALDLDHFKNINDTVGHACGDQALSSFAHICRRRLRAVDTIGRVGGEEFAVLLPATDTDGATIVAETLRQAVEAASIPAGAASISMTVSIGIAAWTAGDIAGDSVLAEADRALYVAKNAGRNCVRWAQRLTG